MESDWDSIERENPMKIIQRRPSNQLKQPQWKVLSYKEGSISVHLQNYWDFDINAKSDSEDEANSDNNKHNAVFWDAKIIIKGASIEEIRQQIWQTIGLDTLEELKFISDVNEEI